MEQDTASAVAELRKIKGIGDEIAMALIAQGLDTIEMVQAAPDEQLKAIPSLGDKVLKAIRSYGLEPEDSEQIEWAEADIAKAKRDGKVCNVAVVDGEQMFTGNPSGLVFIGYPNQGREPLTEWAGTKLMHVGFDDATACHVYVRAK